MKTIPFTLSLSALLIVASNLLADTPAATPPFRALPADIEILHSASTPAELYPNDKPALIISTAQQDLACLLWADFTADHKPSFRLEPAYHLKTPDGPKWVCIQVPKDPNSNLDADLKWPARELTVGPREEHDGLSSYATQIASNPEHGTLFQVGWVNGPVGNGLYEKEARMFVLRDPVGKLQCVGSMPGDTHSHYDASSVDMMAVAWTGKPDAPINLKIVHSTFEYDSECDETVPARYPFSLYQEKRLEGPGLSKSTDVGHPYINVTSDLKEESIDTMANKYSQWVLGEVGGARPENAAERNLFVAAVRRLNPKLAGVSPLQSDAKVLVPTTKEWQSLTSGQIKIEELKVDISSP